MSKQDRSSVNNAVNGANQDVRNKSGELSTQLNTANQGLQNSADQNQAGARTGFNRVNNSNGGYDSDILKRINDQYSSVSQNGGTDSENYKNSQAAFGGARTAFDSAGKSINNASGSFDNAGRSFGEASSGLARAKQGYENFADTGGFSQADKAAYLRQGTSAAPALYKNLATNLQQRELSSGGGNPGGLSGILALQRQAGNQLGTLNTQANTNLNQQVNANKFQGLSGIGTTAGQETSLGNSQVGLGQAQVGQGQAQTGLGTAQAGLGVDQGNLSNAIAALKLQGTQGLASTQQNLVGNQLNASQGLAGLYGTNQSAINNNVAAQLGLFNGTNSAINTGLQTRAGISNQPGWQDNLISGIGAGIGGLATLCWIAEELYGREASEVTLIRFYLNNSTNLFARSFAYLYRMVGQSVAEIIKTNRLGRFLVSSLFDRILQEAM